MNDGVKSAFTGCRTFDSLRLLGHASIFQQLSHLRGGDQLPAYLPTHGIAVGYRRIFTILPRS